MSDTKKHKKQALIKREQAEYVANNQKGQKARNDRENKGNWLHQAKVFLFGE